MICFLIIGMKILSFLICKIFCFLEVADGQGSVKETIIFSLFSKGLWKWVNNDNENEKGSPVETAFSED